jgi:sigma-B regulation protein RsbU (phosphoserine phosphatase)
MKSLDRLYLENSAFEGDESFATVFYALVAANRKVLTYANAGHEPAFMVHVDGSVDILRPTAPLIGVFDDQHHLFRQDVAILSHRCLFVGATDGVTEARDDAGEMFGMSRLIEVVRANRHEALPPALVDRVIGEVQTFSTGPAKDDMAIVAVRFL